MDAGLHSSQDGFGEVIQFCHTQTNEVINVDGVLMDDDPAARLHSSNEKSRGIHVGKPIKYHIVTSQLPNHIDDYEVTLSDSQLYDVASISRVDSSVSELIFTPVKEGAPANGSWLKGDE